MVTPTQFQTKFSISADGKAGEVVYGWENAVSMAGYQFSRGASNILIKRLEKCASAIRKESDSRTKITLK